jgi:hypothetical protein
VVVDDVEHDFDAGRMQLADRDRISSSRRVDRYDGSGAKNAAVS